MAGSILMYLWIGTAIWMLIWTAEAWTGAKATKIHVANGRSVRRLLIGTWILFGLGWPLMIPICLWWTLRAAIQEARRRREKKRPTREPFADRGLGPPT